MRGLLFSNDFKKLTIEPHKFRRRLFMGLPEQSKDIVKRLCVRTLDDFHAERSLLSTASQLLSGYAASSPSGPRNSPLCDATGIRRPCLVK